MSELLSDNEIWNAKYTNTEERNALLRDSSKTYPTALRELEDKKLIKAVLAKLLSVDMGTVREEIAQTYCNEDDCDLYDNDGCLEHDLGKCEYAQNKSKLILSLIQPLLAQAEQKGKTDVVEKIKALENPLLFNSKESAMYGFELCRQSILKQLEEICN